MAIGDVRIAVTLACEDRKRRNWSFLHDVKLLARTVPVVLARRGSN